jgi:hypothetical protein
MKRHALAMRAAEPNGLLAQWEGGYDSLMFIFGQSPLLKGSNDLAKLIGF